MAHFWPPQHVSIDKTKIELPQYSGQPIRLRHLLCRFRSYSKIFDIEKLTKYTNQKKRQEKAKKVCTGRNIFSFVIYLFSWRNKHLVSSPFTYCFETRQFQN